MDCHRPLAFAMIVWVGCGDYHNEIATASTKPRNDRFGLCTVVAILRLPRAFGSRNDDSCFCHCEQSEAIYKPHSSPRHIIASKAKQSINRTPPPATSLRAKRSNPQPPFALPFDEAIHNH